jgi:tetratricopeptide (TPR) repeat protein
MGFSTSTQAATPLQAARLEMGWKQAQTIRALRQAAIDEGVGIAEERSLKTMLSRWENAHDRPDAVYQRLLCRIYECSTDELGLVGEDVNRPAVLPRVAPVIGPGIVDYFRNVFVEHIRADNLMGPHHLVDVVRAQAALLDQMLPNARGEVRRELLYLACRYNEFTGWLYQDACDPDNAMRYADRSMDYALEIDDPRETAYVLMRKADIAGDLGKPDRAIGLTEAGLRHPSQVPPRIRALILRERGRAYARLGNPSECARALDSAREEVQRPDDASDELASYCTPSYIDMEAANCWSELGKFDAATVIYEHSLDTWPKELPRDQGLCLARLTNAHAGRANVERACEAGRRAVEVVRSATSSRAFVELQRARVRLAPWRRHAEVSDLSDRIRGLIQPAA